MNLAPAGVRQSRLIPLERLRRGLPIRSVANNHEVASVSSVHRIDWLQRQWIVGAFLRARRFTNM